MKRSIPGDILRGLAILCVVINHSVITHPVDLTAVPWCSFLKMFADQWLFNMALFFFLSGYFYHCESYRPYIVKKIRRILVPYLIWAAVNNCMYVFGGALVHETISLREGIISYLTGVHLWFLFTLFLLFLIYPWIDRFLPALWQKGLLCAVCFSLYALNIGQIGQLGSVIHYLPCFVLGHVCRREQWLQKGRLADAVSGHPVITFFISLALAVLFRYLYIVSGSRFLLAPGCVTVFMTLYMVLQLPTLKKESRFTLALMRMGHDSLQIYILNFYIIPVMKLIVCRLLGITNPFIIFFTFCIACIVPVVWACDHVFRRSRFLRFIFGMP